MKRLFLTTAIAAAMLTMPAFAQEAPKPPDQMTMTFSRQTVLTIGQGLMKLPYETAAPILNDLQAQLNAADKAAVDKVAAASKPTEPPADPEKPGSRRPK